MSLMLPPEVSKLLNELGLEWPEGDEDKIFNNGGRWIQYGGEVNTASQNTGQTTNSVLQANQSSGIQAFVEDINRPDGVTDVTKNLSIAGHAMGGVVYLIGAAVIALKIVFIVNLVSTVIQIASAIAAAVPTAGASLGWIPVAKILCQKAIQMGINFAISKLLGG